MKLTILVDPPSSLAEKKMEHLSHAGGNPQVVGINATDGQVQPELDGWLGLGRSHTHQAASGKIGSATAVMP